MPPKKAQCEIYNNRFRHRKGTIYKIKSWVVVRMFWPASTKRLFPGNHGLLILSLDHPSSAIHFLLPLLSSPLPIGLEGNRAQLLPTGLCQPPWMHELLDWEMFPTLSGSFELFPFPLSPPRRMHILMALIVPFNDKQFSASSKGDLQRLTELRTQVH